MEITDAIWQQLGAAGILGLFALQVVREVLNFKGRGENGHTYGAMRKAIVDAVQPLASGVQEIRSDTDKLRASQHRANEIAQVVAGKLDLAHVKLDSLVRHTEQQR